MVNTHLIVDVEGPFYYQSINDSSFYRVEHPNDILEWVLIEAPELDNEASDQFKDDLTNSAANMIFAISYQAYSMKGESQPLFDIIKIIMIAIYVQNKLLSKVTPTSRCKIKKRYGFK